MTTPLITAPCWRDDIPNHAYHSGGLCDGVEISSTGLKQIALDCPAIYWAQSSYNPKREVTSSAALDFGSAAHALILGEPTFDAEFVISPYDDFRSKEAREWRNGQERTIVTAADFATIQKMAAEQRSTPHCARAFDAGVPERSFFWREPETGVWLRARPDWFPLDPASRYIVEFKTAQSVRPDKFAQSAFDYGYHIQAALMLDVVAGVLGEKPLGIAHVVQMKTAPYLADLTYFTADQIEHGRRAYKRALRTFAACWERHKSGAPERVAWPGYSAEPTPIETPFRVAKQLEQETEVSLYEPVRSNP